MTAPIGVQPPRSGNPGVVPAWLAAPVIVGGAAPAPAPAPRAPHSSSEVAASSTATADAVRGIILIPIERPGGSERDGGPIRIFLPGGLGGLPGGLGGLGRLPGGLGGQPGGKPRPTERDAAPGEREQFEKSMATVQSFWSKLGVGADAGNGPAPTVRFMDNYPNASYAHGEVGDPEEFRIGNDSKTGKSYAVATDVIAHEYAHRVVNHVLGQQGVGESGAVNESLADTFAAAVDTKNWVIGEDARPEGIRDMQHPEKKVVKLPDAGEVHLPGHMKDYVETEYDKGGVHINVGIPNKAAAAIGESLGRGTMARIYLDAIVNNMPRNGGIADLADATITAARERFGSSSREANAVLDAWNGVGLLADAPTERARIRG